MKKKMPIIFVTLVALFILTSTYATIAYSYNEKIDNKNVPQFLKNKFIQIINKNNFNLKYPRTSNPKIVEKHENFRIIFQADEFDNIYAYIETAYEPIVDTIWLDIISYTQINSEWSLNVDIPDNTPLELYNLTIIISIDGKFYSSSQPRAVNIIDHFSDNFTFIHVADFHVGDPRGFAESIKETIGHKSIKKCIEEINLLKPDFVIFSGDLVFGQLYPREYTREYKKCYELLQKFDVPTYLSPGNHDGYCRISEDGLEIWEEYFGPLYYSFDYGNYHFLSLNSFDWPKFARRSISCIALNWGGSIRNEQLQWIEDDLSNNDANLTFMFLHHNPLWDTKNNSLLRWGYNNREELLSLIYKQNVDMVLAGHIHIDNVTIENKTIFITTTTPASEIRMEDGYWGFRQIEIKNGKINSYNYKEPKYSIPTYHLNINYENPYTAIVENDLAMDINAHLEFIVPLGCYKVNNGDIVSLRNDNYRTHLIVKSKVEKESLSRITIYSE